MFIKWGRKLYEAIQREKRRNYNNHGIWNSLSKRCDVLSVVPTVAFAQLKRQDGHFSVIFFKSGVNVNRVAEEGTVQARTNS